MNPRANTLLADAIMRTVAREVEEVASVNLAKLMKVLPKIVEDAYYEAVRYASDSLIGRASPRGADNRNNGYDVMVQFRRVSRWKALSVRTIREQNAMHGTKNSGKFFLQTGALRKEIKTFARNYVKKTGVIRATMRNKKGQFQRINSDSKAVEFAKFTLRLLPNVSRASLPGLQSGKLTDHNPDMSFERRLGMSPEAIRKLRGAGKGNFVLPDTHRPMMQPVFTYWTLNRIPEVISSAIADNVNTAAGGYSPR